MLVSRVKVCSDWGFPFDAMDLRMLVKGYLDKKGVIVPKLKFHKNLPGREWVCSFLTTDKSELTMIMC